MKTFLFSLLFIPFLVFGATPLVYSDEGLAIMLHDTPCQAKEVTRFLDKDKLSEWKAASIMWQNQPFKACWAVVPDGMAPVPVYAIVDESGDGGFMPKADFKPDTGKVTPQGTKI